MKIKDIIIIGLLLALVGLSYVLGYRSGQLRDVQMREARARLIMNVGLYEALQRGDTRKAQSDLGVFVLGQTRTFEREFGAPNGADSFAPRFARAQAIATQVESQLVRFDSPRDLINAIEKTNATPK